MTDQKSDQPGGDGLLPCPFCNGEPWSDINFSGKWQTTCKECHCGTPAAFETRSLSEIAWNTRPPTRDGAEGADTCFIERSEVRKILIGQPDENLYITEAVLAEVDALRIFTASDFSAPPKPAPDAMHLDGFSLSLRSIAHHVRDHKGEPELAGIIECAADELERRSAPVPPADEEATAILNTLEETGKYLRRADPATIDMDGVTAILLTGIKQLRPLLSPSGTGAAEPGNREKILALAGRIDAAHFIKLIGMEQDVDADEREFIVEALQRFATPPVRGDRELLEQCAKLARQFELDMSGSQLDDRDIENIQHGANVASNAIADAILSLPVQPGAGERS